MLWWVMTWLGSVPRSAERCRACTYFVDDFDYFHWRKCLITVRIQNFKDLFLSLISMLDVEFDFFNWILSKQVLYIVFFQKVQKHQKKKLP